MIGGFTERINVPSDQTNQKRCFTATLISWGFYYSLYLPPIPIVFCFFLSNSLDLVNWSCRCVVMVTQQQLPLQSTIKSGDFAPTAINLNLQLYSTEMIWHTCRFFSPLFPSVSPRFWKHSQSVGHLLSEAPDSCSACARTEPHVGYRMHTLTRGPLASLWHACLVYTSFPHLLSESPALFCALFVLVSAQLCISCPSPLADFWTSTVTPQEDSCRQTHTHRLSHSMPSIHTKHKSRFTETKEWCLWKEKCRVVFSFNVLVHVAVGMPVCCVWKSLWSDGQQCKWSVSDVLESTPLVCWKFPFVMGGTHLSMFSYFFFF